MIKLSRAIYKHCSTVYIKENMKLTVCFNLVKLKGIMFNEINQREKNTSQLVSHSFVVYKEIKQEKNTII